MIAPAKNTPAGRAAHGAGFRGDKTMNKDFEKSMNELSFCTRIQGYVVACLGVVVGLQILVAVLALIAHASGIKR